MKKKFKKKRKLKNNETVTLADSRRMNGERIRTPLGDNYTRFYLAYAIMNGSI